MRTTTAARCVRDLYSVTPPYNTRHALRTCGVTGRLNPYDATNYAYRVFFVAQEQLRREQAKKKSAPADAFALTAVSRKNNKHTHTPWNDTIFKTRLLDIKEDTDMERRVIGNLSTTWFQPHPFRSRHFLFAVGYIAKHPKIGPGGPVVSTRPTVGSYGSIHRMCGTYVSIGKYIYMHL